MYFIQTLIDYLSCSVETYELVVMPSQAEAGLWVAMIRECGPDGMVRIDSETETSLMQVADTVQLAIEALELQCFDMMERIRYYNELRALEDEQLTWLTYFWDNATQGL